MPLVLSLGVSAAQSTMNFGGPARGTEATTFILGEVHPASMSKTSPRAANSSSVGGFSRIAREAEVRNGRHLRRSKAVECIESSEVSPTTKGIKGALALGTGGAPVPAAPLSCDSRRGQPLVEWVWPSNTSPSALSKLAEKVGVSPGEISRDGSCQENTKHHMPPRSPVVIGKICEPVRPTRLDLSTCEARSPTSRVIYSARGGHNLTLEIPSSTGVGASGPASARARPSPLHRCALQDAGVPAAASSGTGGGWGRIGRWGSGSTFPPARTPTATSIRSPRYLSSTTVSQAKTVEPSGAGGGNGNSEVWSRTGKKLPRSRPRRRSSIGRDHPLSESTRNGNRAFGCKVRGSDHEEAAGGCVGSCAVGVGSWGAGGIIESLGGFLGIGKRGGEGSLQKPPPTPRGLARKQQKPAKESDTRHAGPDLKKNHGHSTRPTRGSGLMSGCVLISPKQSCSGCNGSCGGGSGRSGSGKVRKERRSGERRAKPKVAAKASCAPELTSSTRGVRRDERQVLTENTRGVLKPEEIKFRIVKASGRSLRDTLFHMEIRTLRPGQVWSVCRRYGDFQELHAALQARCHGDTASLPRLPRPPSTGVLEPAALERARTALQAYMTAVESDMPSAWSSEEFVMFLDSEEKGRRLFGRRRKKEPRRTGSVTVAADQSQAQSQRQRMRPASGPAEDRGADGERQGQRAEENEGSKAEAPGVESPGAPSAEAIPAKTFLDLKMEEKRLAMAAIEGAAQNHFDGVGAVMNTAVSFSTDDEELDMDLEAEAGFIDGEEAIMAMLDRDAQEAEDDNLFNIPAGTDFGAFDDDLGDDFDLSFHEG